MTPESLRVKQWRESNRDRYNANQRALMKARRLKARKEKAERIIVTEVPYKP